jgi:soluble lytic murein transglycosylase-like protein
MIGKRLIALVTLAVALLLFLEARPHAAHAVEVPVSVAPAAADCTTVARIIFARAENLTFAQQERVAFAVCEEARRVGYDARWVLAVMEVESDFDAAAVSPVGARGLMQLTDVTAAYLAQQQGVSLVHGDRGREVEWNVRLGVRYLADLHRRFQDLDIALIAYNAGPGRVRELRTTGGLHAFRGYPAKVRAAFDRFQDEDRARREAMSLSP